MEDIAAGLEKLLNDNAYRHGLVQKGFKHAQTFSAQAMASKTLDIYKMIAR